MLDKLKSIFTKPVIIGGIIISVLLCCLVLTLQIGVFPYVNITSSQKAIVAITPVQTDIEAVIVSPTAVLEETENLPGVVSLGMTVQVSGTGQDGLRMRAEPGTDQTVVFVANEGEYFSIIDGPVIKDSLIWWKIQALDNAQKVGWSVQDYLMAVQF